MVSKPHNQTKKDYWRSQTGNPQYLCSALCGNVRTCWGVIFLSRWVGASLLIHHIREAAGRTRLLHKHSFVGSSHVKGQTWAGRRLLSGLLVFSFITLKADKISTSSSHSLSHQSWKKKREARSCVLCGCGSTDSEDDKYQHPLNAHSYFCHLKALKLLVLLKSKKRQCFFCSGLVESPFSNTDWFSTKSVVGGCSANLLSPRKVRQTLMKWYNTTMIKKENQQSNGETV